MVVCILYVLDGKGDKMRLIDADALIEHIKKYMSVFARYDWREICDKIDNAPTIKAISAEEHAEIVGKLCAKFAEEIKDFEPIRHGHWEKGIDMFGNYYKCSVCDSTEDIGWGFDYCPNCGAKMDEVEK